MGSISIILVLPLLVLAMIACGPADQAIQEKIGNISQVTPQEEEETPEPCPHTEQTYPNLDDALADIVSKYETCQLTEEQAAAEAPEYHGSKVLVEIDAETNTRANTLDEWMGEQSISPRHALAEWEAPVIYAFVRVSMVGILSNQNAAGNIKASSPPFDPNVEYQSPAKALGRERASEEPPIFPAWLKGNVPSPGHYPKLRGVLGYIARQYDLGTLDLQSLKNHEFFGCYIEDEMVGGYLYILDNDKALQRIETWLSESDTEWNNERITEGQFRVIPVRILPSKLSDLSKHTDLVKVDQGVCGGMDDSSTGQPSGTNTTPEAFGTIESQGIRTIGAEDWHNNTTTQYIGSAKRIGIIDAGFKGFDTQINDGEVPTPTEYFCFNSYHDTTISNTAAECRLASSHGTAVAETVIIHAVAEGHGPRRTTLPK